ncbi:MAG TPA: transcriptional regulator NrdR [Actinomycetota bacterium]|nr:transcriptional regulator NrdR [Actinomycetota bacterium]
MLWPLLMRCPWCDADHDRVVDSRPADAGGSIRRRRACLACGRRFTTYERVEGVGVVVVKRDGSKELFDREKLEAGIRKALAGRPAPNEAIEELVDRIEQRIRRKGPEVSSRQVGAEVLSALKRTDEVAYLRYASVYKDFEDIADFERELGLLGEKKEPAKRRPRSSVRH